MNPAQSLFTPAATVLEIIRQRIAAITLANGAPAFDRVAIFDTADTETALQELVVSGDRIALIFLTAEQFKNTREGRTLVSIHTLSISVVFSDLNLGNRQAALIGDAHDPAQPGALGLRDLLLGLKSSAPVQPWLIGRLTVEGNGPQFYLQPSSGQPVILRDAARQDLAGRACWESVFEAVGGRVMTDLGQSPIT